MVIDPICGMRIEADDAAATAEHEGQIYFFCSEGCRDVFLSSPSAYGARAPTVTDADRLTDAEVAKRAGVSAERVRELVNLGILAPEDGAFVRRDVMRVRVVAELEAKGLDPQALASAYASGHLTLGYLESAGRRHPRIDRTFAEFSEQIGFPIDTLQSLYMAFGLPRPRPDEYVRADDEPILKALPVLFGAGVGEGDVLRALRIWGDSAGRVAQFQAHYLHNTIEHDSEAEETLVRAARDPSSDVRAGALRGIEAARMRGASAIALESLRDPNAEVRAEALRAVAATAPDNAVAPLVDALADDDLRVRAAAVDGLATAADAGGDG
jgi:Cu+-exporting ATPase